MSFSSGRNISNNVNTDEAQTLTNKTIDSANNSLVVDADTATVSNIEADNLKAGVIDDDLSTTSVNDDTVPSAKAAKAYTDAAAATAASDLSTHEADTSTHGVSGDIVGTSDTQTLTNKTIQGASVETPSRLDAKKDTLNNLETYATTATDGELTYATDDEKFYGVVNNELVSLGGGLGSAQTVFTIEADTVNVAADVDGNDATFGGNDASSLTGTLSQSTTASELLTGVKKVNKYEAAASSQFDYFGYTRAIPQGWAGRTVAVEFTYRNNANTSNDDYTFNVKDETNNSVLLTRSLEAKVSADGNGETLRYLVNIPTDCLSVTIGFQNVGTATDTALFFDKISMDIDDFNYKNVESITEWEKYEPTTQGFGTLLVSEVYWRQVGDSVEVQGFIQTGTVTSDEARLYLPNGYTIKNIGSGNSTYDTQVGVYVRTALVDQRGGIVIGNVGHNYIRFGDRATFSNQLNIDPNLPENGNTLSSNNQGITFNFTVPVNELTATSKHVVVDSGEADTEYYSVPAGSSNFWDGTSTINAFDFSLIDLTNSKFLRWEESLQEGLTTTKLYAIQDVDLDVSITGVLNAGTYLRCFDSSNNFINYVRQSAGGYIDNVHSSLRLSAGDFIYWQNVSAASRTGGITIKAQKANKGEYHLVPVSDQENVYSARYSIAGATTNNPTEISKSSDWITSFAYSSDRRYRLDFSKMGVTEFPVILANIKFNNGSVYQVEPIKISDTVVEFLVSPSDNANYEISIMAQKQGADYNEPKVFIGDVIPVKVAVLKDVKPNGTEGGTFTGGTWTTRTLNTLENPTKMPISLSNNQFTLTKGTYEFDGYCPAYAVNSHICKLYNVTDATDQFLGLSSYSSSGGGGYSPSILKGVITITESKTFELQHICGTTKTSNGLGTQVSATGADEVYAQLTIRRIE